MPQTSPFPALSRDDLAPLRDFIVDMASLVERATQEQQILDAGSGLLARLVAQDGWLPDALAQPHPEFYRQYLLHADALGRFSVVSFVWGPGQQTPVHDHTVWGLIGVLRGAEYEQAYRQAPDGAWVAEGAASLLQQGQVAAVSPSIGDVHRVRNAYEDRVSISIHVYGANIGAVSRHVYRDDGSVAPFISGYSNAWLPNLWDASNNA